MSGLCVYVTNKAPEWHLGPTCTLGCAVHGLPLVVPLRLDGVLVVLAVRRVGRGVRGAVLVQRELAVRVRVCPGSNTWVM